MPLERNLFPKAIAIRRKAISKRYCHKKKYCLRSSLKAIAIREKDLDTEMYLGLTIGTITLSFSLTLTLSPDDMVD